MNRIENHAHKGFGQADTFTKINSPSQRGKMCLDFRGSLQALILHRKKYGDFGPTFASEKLSKLHGIEVSDERCDNRLRVETSPAGLP